MPAREPTLRFVGAQDEDSGNDAHDPLTQHLRHPRRSLIVSCFEWGQDLQFFLWKEDGANSRLRDILTNAFHRTLRLAQQEGVDLRTAALMEAVTRVGRATKLRGIYP